MQTTESKKALLVTCYGASDPAVYERTFSLIIDEVAAAFPDRTLYTAWTSQRMREAAIKRGEFCPSPVEDTLALIASDSVTDLYVVPICLMRGMEMRRVEKIVNGWKHPGITVKLGTPLLSSDYYRSAVAQALVEEYSQVEDNDMLVLMGHGSLMGGNEVFQGLNDGFAAIGHPNFRAATMLGKPSIKDALKTAQERNPRKIYLMPLMIGAGHHAHVDMAGHEPHSWRNKFAEAGYATEAITRGIGEYASIRQIFVDHALSAFKNA